MCLRPSQSTLPQEAENEILPSKTGRITVSQKGRNSITIPYTAGNVTLGTRVDHRKRFSKPANPQQVSKSSAHSVKLHTLFSISEFATASKSPKLMKNIAVSSDQTGSSSPTDSSSQTGSSSQRASRPKLAFRPNLAHGGEKCGGADEAAAAAAGGAGWWAGPGAGAGGGDALLRRGGAACGRADWRGEAGRY
ncbi:hypothetical protein K432DRAFT_442888 [Lepidopterella palustris CBS 459.81]|uniref:Uncharacterized protein n=1 Tax=Lepidopterella palustris CBS 459.81 TaxID=1314670 RepID=A0A8E2EBN3_9PEZI|nr:hypothetical protein K432DRAFT_442888 [Lepidopterella palustris CBS 459.81]